MLWFVVFAFRSDEGLGLMSLLVDLEDGESQDCLLWVVGRKSLQVRRGFCRQPRLASNGDNSRADHMRSCLPVASHTAIHSCLHHHSLMVNVPYLVHSSFQIALDIFSVGNSIAT